MNETVILTKEFALEENSNGRQVFEISKDYFLGAYFELGFDSYYDDPESFIKNHDEEEGYAIYELAEAAGEIIDERAMLDDDSFDFGEVFVSGDLIVEENDEEDDDFFDDVDDLEEYI